MDIQIIRDVLTHMLGQGLTLASSEIDRVAVAVAESLAQGAPVSAEPVL